MLSRPNAKVGTACCVSLVPSVAPLDALDTVSRAPLPMLMGVAPNPESSKVTPVTPSSQLLPRKLLLTTLIPQRYPVGLDHQAAMPYGSKEAMPSLPCTLQRAP